MVDLIELYTHWWAGRSKNALAQSLGLDRKTVRKYLAPAEAAGMVPGGREVSPEQWRELAARWFPSVTDARVRQVTWPQFDAHIDYIREQVGQDVPAAVIHQRLRDEKGVSASVRSLDRWMAATLTVEDFGSKKQAARVTARMPAPVAGALGEVDYGLLGQWTDLATGKRHKIQAFIMTLPFSKMVFVYPTISMRQDEWSAAHVAAFEFFGAVPRRVTSDNLKTGVIKPDLYDPRLNRSYRELGEHYGLILDPARAVKPRDKPHVERAVPYVRGSFWAGRASEFRSLEHMRAEAERWGRDVAGCRGFREFGTTRPIEVFERDEKPTMIPLPLKRFEIATWSRAKVAGDCHVSVKGVLYSVPYRLIGQHLDVRLARWKVDFYYQGELVKTHPRKTRGRVSDIGDYPPQHLAYLTRDAAWCRKQAAEIGPACATVVEQLQAIHALAKLRSCQGIIAMAGTDRADGAKVEAACALALEAGDPSYRTVKNLLTCPPPVLPAMPQGDNGAGAILRGPAAFVRP